MSAEASKKPLGRGLSALLGEESVQAATRPTPTVPVEKLRPGRYQPRRRFDDADMAELVESVKAHGVLQPILVRADGKKPGHYEIVAGERRWRAAQAARLAEVPVTIKAMDDRAALEIALIENLQREGLSSLEEAQGYRRLLDEFKHTQDALAKSIGKSRSHVANTLRLLDLPDEVKALLDEGKLSAGHARALLGAPNAAELAREIVRRGLNVRQAEALAARAKAPARPRAPRVKDSDTAALERDLSELLGLKVNISFGGAGGVLTIHYGSLEQLDDVLNRLNLGTRAAGEARRAPAVPAAADSTDVAEKDEEPVVVDWPAEATAAAATGGKATARGKSPDLPAFLRKKK